MRIEIPCISNNFVQPSSSVVSQNFSRSPLFTFSVIEQTPQRNQTYWQKIKNWIGGIIQSILSFCCCSEKVEIEKLGKEAQIAFSSMKTEGRDLHLKLYDFWKLAYFLSTNPSEEGKQRMRDAFALLPGHIQQGVGNHIEEQYKKLRDRLPEQERNQLTEEMTDGFGLRKLTQSAFDPLVIKGLEEAYYSHPKTRIQLAKEQGETLSLADFRSLLDLKDCHEMSKTQLDEEIVQIWLNHPSFPKVVIYQKMKESAQNPNLDVETFQSAFRENPRTALIRDVVSAFVS